MMIVRALEVSEKRIMFGILAGAFLLRLLYIIEIINTPFIDFLFSDSKLFIELADSFFSDVFWTGNDPFLISPLYPIILGSFRIIFGDNNFIIYLLQVLINTLTLMFIYITAKNIFNKNVAFISFLIASLFDSYIFYSGLILSETFEIFFITLFFYYISDKTNFEQVTKWLIIGLILGTLVLLRESILIVVLTLVLYIIFSNKNSFKVKISKWKIISTLVGGVFIMVLPFTIMNYIISEELIITNASEGIYFNFANGNGSNGLIPNDNHNFEKDLSGKEIASNFSGKKVSAGEALNYFYGKTTKDILDEPIQFLSLITRKAVLFFNSEHFPKSSIMDIKFYEENFSDILKLPLVSYGVISILFLMGLTFYLKTGNKNSLILLLLFSFYLIVLFSFASVKYKLGITPIMIVFGAFGIVNIYNCIAENNFKPIQAPLFITLFFILINTFLINKPTISNYDAYYQFGNIFQEEERYEEAIYNFNRSLLLKDRYETLMELGNTFAMKKDFTNAMSAYNEAEKRRDDDYYLYFNKGIVFSQSGQYDKALEAYNLSLKLNPEHYPVYRNIGIVFYVNENYSEALNFFNRFLNLSKDEETNALVRKDIENIRLKLGGNN